MGSNCTFVDFLKFLFYCSIFLMPEINSIKIYLSTTTLVSEKHFVSSPNPRGFFFKTTLNIIILFRLYFPAKTTAIPLNLGYNYYKLLWLA